MLAYVAGIDLLGLTELVLAEASLRLDLREAAAAVAEVAEDQVEVVVSSMAVVVVDIVKETTMTAEMIDLNSAIVRRAISVLSHRLVHPLALPVVRPQGNVQMQVIQQ